MCEGNILFQLHMWRIGGDFTNSLQLVFKKEKKQKKEMGGHSGGFPLAPFQR